LCLMLSVAASTAGGAAPPAVWVLSNTGVTPPLSYQRTTGQQLPDAHVGVYYDTTIEARVNATATDNGTRIDWSKKHSDCSNLPRGLECNAVSTSDYSIDVMD